MPVLQIHKACQLPAHLPRPPFNSVMSVLLSRINIEWFQPNTKLQHLPILKYHGDPISLKNQMQILRHLHPECILYIVLPIRDA